MIPRTLHFVWLNDDTPSFDAESAIDTWRTHAPQFAVQVWNRSMIADQWGAKMLGTDLTLAVLSDLLRVHIIYEFGGVYLDCDIFAQNDSAGKVLAEVCDGCSLFGASFAGGGLNVDTVPMGATAGLPGFAGLARRPDQFMNSWNRYLATSQLPPMILSGTWWNAAAPGAGVKAVHRRGLLRPAEPPRPSRRPERPTLVIKGRKAAADYEAALSRAKAVRSGVRDRLELIAQIPKLPGPRVAVEVGTDRGEYAEQIAERWTGRLWCIDPYRPTVDDISDPHTNRDRQADKAAAELRLARFPHAAIAVDTSLHAAESFDEGTLDFVYIDPNHYEIRADLAAWWPKVKPGGIMAGHDITGEWEPWIRPAVEEFAFWEKVTPMVTLDTPASWFFVKR